MKSSGNSDSDRTGERSETGKSTKSTHSHDLTDLEPQGTARLLSQIHAEELEEEACRQIEYVSSNSTSRELSAVKALCRRSQSLEAQDTIDASTESFVSHYNLQDTCRDKD